MSSLADTTGGFYMNGNGNFIFGKYGGNRVSWDGTNLQVVTEEISIEYVGESLKEEWVDIKVTNNTNVTQYCRPGYEPEITGNSITYTASNTTILANASKTIRLTDTYPGNRYKIAIKYDTNSSHSTPSYTDIFIIR